MRGRRDSDINIKYFMPLYHKTLYTEIECFILSNAVFAERRIPYDCKAAGKRKTGCAEGIYFCAACVDGYFFAVSCQTCFCNIMV